MKLRLPLRITLPLLIFGAGLVIVIAAWWLEHRNTLRNSIRVAEVQLRSTANFIAAEVEAAYREGNVADARSAIERAASNPIMRKVYVVDPSGNIRFSNDPRAVDRHLADDPATWEIQETLDALPEGQITSVPGSGQKARLGAKFPLQMRMTANDLMPSHLGALYLVVDVSSEVSRQQASVSRRMLRWTGVLGLVAIGFWLLLRRLLLHRIDRLVDSVRAVGRGNFDQSPDIGGYDELADLGEEMCTMSASLRDHSARLAYLADHDALTGLLNRHGFESRLEQGLEDMQRHETRLVLVLLDIDSLRVINDTQGHAAGDKLLQMAARQFADALPESIASARVGGDEFAFLLETPGDDDDCLESIAQRLLNRTSSFRFEYGEARFGVQVSTGLVELTTDIESAADALGYADAACYRAKETGRGGFHIGSVDPFSNERIRGEMKWVSRIQSAVDQDRLKLFAQPILPIGADADKGLHLEILVRMIDEHGSVLPPAEFLPAAERYNLVHLIDRWVVRRVLKRIKEEPRLAETVSTWSINLSGTSLGKSELFDEIGEWLEETGFAPTKLCFEVTETAAIQNLAKARGHVDRLRSLGCRFALDDFGTGLSSFAYFKRLPIDIVKIDGMFVRDVVDDAANREIVSAINTIAHQVGMKTVAEFVENDATLRLLEEMGIDYAQGYGIARPAPLAEVIAAHAATPGDRTVSDQP